MDDEGIIPCRKILDIYSNIYFYLLLPKMELLKEKREIIRPVLMKFGLALAISLGGVVYTFVKIRRIEPSKSKPSPG